MTPLDAAVEKAAEAALAGPGRNTMGDNVTPPDLAEVLAAHRRCFYPDGPAFCACNQWSYPDRTGGTEHHAHQAQAWRDACTITTVEQLDRVPAGAIVQSAAGSIACRFDDRNGVVFGDDRPFPWHKLALPALLIPGWAR